MSFVYNPGIPTGQVDLDKDYLNIQGNFQQANIVYGTDHYPFNNATSNLGFHNQVTTPAFVASPTTGLPPPTTTNPIFYAFQQYPALGVLQYSRGPTTPFNNSVPTPLTNLNSAATPIILGSLPTTILNFSGMAFAYCVLYALDSVQVGARMAAVIFWNGTILSINSTVSSLFISAVASGSTLQLQNNSVITLSNIYWSLQLIRVQ
jgi:hypothetical protein